MKRAGLFTKGGLGLQSGCCPAFAPQARAAIGKSGALARQPGRASLPQGTDKADTWNERPF